jgi:type I restriction enzyme S subunit
MNDWNEVPLGELCSFKSGTGFPKRYQGGTAGDLRFVKVSDMSLPGNERSFVSANNWVSTPVAKEINAYPVATGATVFAKIGEAVKAERLRRIVGPTAIDNNLMAAVPKPDMIDSDFLYYLLHTVRLSDLAEGSALPYLRAGDLAALRVTVPSVREQERIARVLTGLDDLIANNERLARDLGELWRTRVESAVSVGSSVATLSSLAAFVNGKNFTKAADGNGRPVIRTPEVRNGPSASTVRSSVIAADDNIAEAGDVLFVWSGSLMVSRWVWETGLINQHIFKVIPSAGVPDWLAMWAVEELMVEFLGVAADKATTMGHIKRGDLDRNVAVPPVGEWERLDAVVRPLWDAALGARLEAQELRSVRAELLPLLISGRVRTRDAEGLVA